MLSELKQRDWHELQDDQLWHRLQKTGIYTTATRITDILIAITGIIFLSPFWLIMAIWIRLDSPGNPIFSHECVGKDGRAFTLYKLRSMLNSNTQPSFTPTAITDPRVTRIGRFLRRTSLDESPQFINVLQGEMSIVGPRPAMSYIVDTYSDLQRKRLLVKPGITGLWQVMGRKDLPLYENPEYDYYYILNRSITLDLFILCKTLHVVAQGQGAY